MLIIYNNGKKEIYSIDNIKCQDMLYKNRLNESSYKYYNKGFDNEFILVDCKLSDYVAD